MKLYHGSAERLTDLTVRKGSMFNGMFFSADISEANGPGGAKYYYAVDIDDNDILDADEFPYSGDALDKAAGMYTNYSDAGFMLDAMCGDVNIWTDEGDEERVRQILHMGDEYDTSEVSWEIQRQTSLLAEKLGGKAVMVHDEHGTSYIVLPGAKMEYIGEEE